MPKRVRRGSGESSRTETAPDPHDPTGTPADLTSETPGELGMYDDLVAQINALKLQLDQLRPQNATSEQIQRLGSQGSNSAVSNSAISYVIKKESVPLFKAETSASQPLLKNQEIESWIRAIEFSTPSPTSEAYIQMAKSRCRGTAELIINSPIFDGITSWEEFRAKLRVKFRGTCSSGDFFKLLYQNRMMAGQAPLDFFASLEGAVCQGMRDYPRVIGDPDELIRRVFLQGLPQWLREALAVTEDCPIQQLAAAAQRVWNTRVGVRHVDGPTQVALAPPIEFPQQVASGEQIPSNKYCQIHKVNTHDTSECRAKGRSQGPQCYKCKNYGHIARQCSFQPSQHDTVPAASGSYSRGTVGANPDHTNPDRGSGSD